jgi:hypothetical protein
MQAGDGELEPDAVRSTFQERFNGIAPNLMESERDCIRQHPDSLADDEKSRLRIAYADSQRRGIAGGYRTPAEAAIFSAFVVPGVADIPVMRGGRTYGLELKSSAGRLTDAEEKTHERVRRAGCEIATAYSLDEAIVQLETWNLLLGKAAVRRSAATASSSSWTLAY